ncbi:hypothetical protein [Clostridium sp. JNZ J1-5]
MKGLFISELERLWCKKSTWITFLSVPIVLYASARYYLGHNLNVSKISPEFTSFGNFPAAVIQEQLILFFNLAVVLLLILSITEEYRSGQIRMVMIRPISFTHQFLAKIGTILVTLFLLILVYFLLSIPIGYMSMPKIDKVHIFYYANAFTIKGSLLYGIKYYAVSFLTIVAMESVIMFIATISKTITTGMGVGIGFILTSLVYPQILFMFNHQPTVKVIKLQFLSLTHIQHMGIAMMLGENSLFVKLIIAILLVYIVIFTILSYLFFTKRSKDI